MNLSKIIKIFKKTEEQLKSYAIKELKKEFEEVIVGDGYVFARGTFPVLLVAHMDTVHKECPYEFKTNKDKTFLSSPQGIGGDDRNGIYSVLQIVKTHRCSVLFTEDEEIGGIGADKFTKTALAEELRANKTFNYIIELDREGEKDAVFYECDNPEFTEFITQDFWTGKIGSFSDISIIAPFLECAAVNLSCGYYYAHTLNEIVSLKEIDQCIEEVKNLLDRTDIEKQFEYTETEYEDGYNECIIEYKITYKEGEKLFYTYELGRTKYEALGRLFCRKVDLSFKDIVDIL